MIAYKKTVRKPVGSPIVLSRCQAQMYTLGLYPQNRDSFPSGQPDRVSPAECSGLNPHATPVLS